MVRVIKIISIFIVCFTLGLLVFSNFVSAGSLGMSPSSFKFNFEPNLEEKVTIRVADSDLNQLIRTYVVGDLKDYVVLSDNYFVGAGTLEVEIKLPYSLSKPGNHRILIGAVEDKNMSTSGSGSIGGVSAIQVPIDIFVKYPGKYAEAEFSIESINAGEDIPYKLTISNLGTQALNLSSSIKINAENSYADTISDTSSFYYIEPNEKIIVEEKIPNEGIKPGNYIGFAEIDYGEKIILNDSFGVGTFLMNITDYDYQFTAGKINEFSMSAKSFWNSPINEVYLEVSVTDNGTVKSYFKTPIYSFEPWDEQTLTGYIDATNMAPGRYIGNLILNYDGKTINKLVALYMIKPEMSKTEKLLYISLTVIGVFLIIIILLVIKIFLSRRNGRNKQYEKVKIRK